MMTTVLAQMFPFVHPAIAGAAAAAGAIPIIIHLINRRRYRRMPWAAMRFLLAANQRSIRRIRLEQWLLLLLRVAVVVLLGLAIARPYMPASSFWPVNSSRVHRVLLIDNSLSMAGKDAEGKTRFELAMRCANSLVRSFPSSDSVSLVTMAVPAEAVIAHAAYDRRYVRERLTTIKPTQRGTDTVRALEITRKILRESDAAQSNKVVYLISDLLQQTWKSESPGRDTANMEALRRVADSLADSSIDLNVLRVSPDVHDNIAVTSLMIESPLVGLNVPVRIAAEVTNFSQSTRRELSLQLRRNGEIIRRQTIPKLEPGQTSLAMITLEFSKPGTHILEARVAGKSFDALVHDDARYLSVEVRESTPVLLVDGRPGVSLLAGQSGFLATALSPQIMMNLNQSTKLADSKITSISPVNVTVITEPELPGELLMKYDVVALCNVPSLPQEQWKHLEQFVSAGGGLMVFGGDMINTDHYNRFGHQSGKGLLPCTISHPVATAASTGSSNGYKMENLSHPIVTEFVGHPSSGLFHARVDQYHPVELDTHRAEVILRYTDGAPALLLSSYGKGRVMFSTTTANMDWTNLPAKGDFVSLMFNATAYLSRHHGDHRNVMIGQKIHEPLTARESSLSLRVSGANDVTAIPALIPEGDGLALEYGPIEQAGAWSVSIGKQTRMFAANPDPEESDLTPIDDALFLDTLDRPVRLVNDVSAILEQPVQGRSTELASITLYSVVILLLAESLIAVLFGASRKRQSKIQPPVRNGIFSFRRG